MRVLLVEDDPMIGAGMRSGLATQGMAVDWVKTGLNAIEAIETNHYAIVLLDLGLPDMGGLDILRAARHGKRSTPVLIVSARDDVASRVTGLDLGADDYILKPFDFSEMLARMRAVVRRQAGHLVSKIECGDVTLDLASHEVRYRGVSHVLPAREFALLMGLCERAGTILSRAQLEEKLYGFGDEVESNAIDVLIFYIRKKFDPDIIRNIRGAGWMVPRRAA